MAGVENVSSMSSSGDPYWSIDVRRNRDDYDAAPDPSDVPVDILEALTRWAVRGLAPRAGEGSVYKIMSEAGIVE